MRLVLVEGESVLTAQVLDLLSRAHDVTTVDGMDAVGTPGGPVFEGLIMVWPEQRRGRAGAARVLTSVDRLHTLVVIPGELTLDRLGIADTGVDYLVSPFHPLELSRRLDAVAPGSIRRTMVLWAGDTMLDEGARVVERSGRRIDLTRKEFDLLMHFMRNRGMVQQRSVILDAVWGATEYNPNVIEVAVSSLRRKLEVHGPRLIHTVRGVGYVCRLEHAADSTIRTLVGQREQLLQERQRLMQRRDGLIERARGARASAASVRERSGEDGGGSEAGGDVPAISNGRGRARG